MHSMKKKVKFLVNIFIFLVLSLMLTMWLVSILYPFSIHVSPLFPLVDIIGVSSINGSLGGFYLGVGLLLIAYFWRGTKYLKAATILMLASLCSHIFSLINNGFEQGSILMLSITVLAIFAFGWIIKEYPTLRNFMDEVHPDFRKFKFISVNSKGLWRKRTINRILEKKYTEANIADNIKVENYEIEGYEGRKIKVEVFQKKDAIDNAPCMIVYPGGAFWAKPIPSYKYFFNRYINGTGMKVVFEHFTLSLEAPYPAPPEDCYLGTIWAYENAEMLGINKAKIVLYGISSGGTLVGAVSLMLRDRNQFKPCFQMLIYPLVAYQMNTASLIKYSGMPVWKEDITSDLFTLYTKGLKGEFPAYVIPIKAKDFSNLPNAYIEAAEYDCVRDEAEMYAEKLREHGVEAQFYEVKGAVHGFDILLKSEISKAAFQRRIKILNKVFNE